MDSDITHDKHLAIHMTRLTYWVVGRVAIGLTLGTLLALVVGAVAWQAGNVGWVFAAPGLGLLVLSVTLSLGSAPAP